MKKNIIIDESVFRKETFNDLFEFIKNKNFKLLTTNELMEYFPIKSRSFKILGKNKNQNLYKLYVINDDFSDKEKVKNILLKISADKEEINEDDVNLIFNYLNKALASFTPLKTEKDFGILWLHKNKSTLEDFQHEFIHYLEWIGGIYASKFKENDEYFDEEDEFKEIFNIENEEDIEYMLNKFEYQTMLNDFFK